MTRGAPSKFDPKFVKQAEKLAALGATDREVADFLEISEATLYRWKVTQPDFCEALKVGKAAPDQRVVQSLYRRAVGYSFDSEKIFRYRGEIVRAEFVEHVPPDVTACIFWLKNRDPEAWRANPEGGGDGALSDAISRLIEGLPC